MAEQSLQYEFQHLKSKETLNAIIQKLSQIFNITPIITEAFFRQFIMYIDEQADGLLSSGEIA